MDLTGKICPYCKTEFKEGDDVVVCSICEMPHHKECWIENKACTTFGCTGTIAGTDLSAEATENKSFCAKCGAPISDTQKFCTSCGAPVNSSETHRNYTAGEYNQNNQMQMGTQIPVQVSQHPNFNQVAQQQHTSGYEQYSYQTSIDQDLYTFIQTNQPFYMRKFQGMQQSNTQISWNWCSFLFGGSWYAYRKMYGIAAAYFSIAFIIGLIPEIGAFLNFILWICSGIFGNYFYKQYIDGELQIAKSMDQFNKSVYISRKGGTSVGAVFLAIVIYLVIVAIIGNI